MPNIIIKHKPRYTLEVSFPQGNIPAFPVRVWASSILEEDKRLITRFYPDDLLKEEQDHWWALLRSFYEQDTASLVKESNESLGSAVLSEYQHEDTELKLVKTFRFIGLWPLSINFGELDFSNNDLLEIEITWKFASYSEAISS